MYDEIICITNRKLCKNSFIEQVELIASSGVDKIILREKDMCEADYMSLAKQVIKISGKNGVECILHSHINVAEQLGYKKIHLPLHTLQNHKEQLSDYDILGVSVHSLTDAEEAIRCGAKYIIAGHIFQTECKRDVPPRGVAFLNSICKETNMPVYAIGGINIDNARLAMQNGVVGVCLMSQFMKSVNPCDMVKQMRENLSSEPSTLLP